jgi:hypothetical protein
MRQHLMTLVETLRVSAAARWMTVEQLRWQTRAVLSERAAQRRLARAAAVPPAQCLDDGREDWLEAEVLRVITRHPEGVRALDIGNELGVDWRYVPAVAGRLVERAIVEQVAHDFYPVQEAR